MSRPKKAEQEQFRHLIRVRVNDAVYERLTKLQKQTDCRSICEMSRKILSGERIKIFHRDASLNGPMEELALIRKELKAIGININQQTYHFHISENSNERAFFVNKTGYTNENDPRSPLQTVPSELRFEKNKKLLCRSAP